MGETPLSLKLLSLGLPSSPVSGRIAQLTEDGIARVTFNGATEPTVARSIVAPSAVPAAELLADAEVLLLFEDGDPRRPVIIGFLTDRLWAPPPAVGRSVDALPDRLVMEAGHEVVLKCGEASIRMTADGRIVTKGTNLSSRASETNKVRGAVVLLN